MSARTDIKSHELYVLTFPNGKKYFGISSCARKRWIEHKKRARYGSRKGRMYTALRKYYYHNIKLEVLAVGERFYIAECEKKAIALFDTTNKVFGYNTTAGGDVSPMHTLSVVNKIRGRKLTEEHKQKLREKAIGRKPPFEAAKASRNGVSLAHLYKNELSKVRKGKKHHPTWIFNRAEALRGKKRTPEQCERIRQGRLRYLASLEGIGV